MAGLARIVAGKGDRPVRRLRDRRAAIVPVLPKTARDDSSAQDDERNQRYRHDGRKPDEVFYVLKQVRIPAPDSAPSARRSAQCALIPNIPPQNDDLNHGSL